MASDRVLISVSRKDFIDVRDFGALGDEVNDDTNAWMAALASPDGIDPAMVEAAARAANLDAGRQRGLAFEDDWDEITEQERGGWRLVARAALRAAAGTDTEGEEA